MILDDKQKYTMSSYEIASLITLLEGYVETLQTAKLTSLWHVEMRSAKENIKLLRDKLKEVTD